MAAANLPSGPRNGMLEFLRYLRDPYQCYLRAARRYGDPFVQPSIDGDIFVTGDPEGIRAIFAADPECYDVYAAGIFGPVIGEHSLILLSGEPHRRERKLLTPPFHGARMRAYGQLMRDVTLAEIARLRAGLQFNALSLTQAISLEVILQGVFGITGERAARFRQLLVEIVAALRPSFLFVPALRRDLFGLSPWARYQRLCRRAEEMIFGEMAARRAGTDGGTNGGTDERQDVMSLLLSARYDDGTPMSDKDIYDQLGTILMAGHETTAISLSWALFYIYRDEGVLARLREEVAALGEHPEPEAVAKLPYLEAVCHEVLRIRPIATQVVRRLRRPLRLLGYDLPAGMGVGACIVLAHHRQEVFPDPERFLPERFLQRSYSPFEFLPFGGGTRRCLGAAFALYEMKIVLATIAGSMQGLRLLQREVPPVEPRNTTVGPRGGVRMANSPTSRRSRAPAR